MRIVSAGHAMFAATMIVIGILGLIHGDFAPIWDSVPKDLPARSALAYCCAVISLATGIGLLWRRMQAGAARLLFVYLLLWLLLFKLRFIVLAPLTEAPYQTCAETAVIIAGAWVLYARFAAEWERQHLGAAVGERGVRLARVTYALALIGFGLSHFAYLKLTAPLVPGWLHAPVFWACFTGCTYLAAAAAMLIGEWTRLGPMLGLGALPRLAAVLSALQIGLFLLLVWAPRVMAGHASAGTWSETVLNVALLAGAWVVADCYRARL